MLHAHKSLSAGLLLCSLPLLFTFNSVRNNKPLVAAAPPARIQAALLLDVSGSMDGLLEQAKTQLWNMVSVLGRADCDRGKPKIEIALYQYGQDFPLSNGYCTQLKPFTTSLDSLSALLFEMHTSGSEEYCGATIHRALSELQWDSDPANYKVIFIAGNESFRQGTFAWEKACEEARQKGIVVNTIHCGSREQGKVDFWDLGAQCGIGSFTNIDADTRIEEPPTPFDEQLITLNTKLNATRIPFAANYGSTSDLSASSSTASQTYAFSISTDEKNMKQSRAAGMKRIKVKANKQLYADANYELIDAADAKGISNLPKEALPDSLKRLKEEELKAFIEKKSAERDAIRKDISQISDKREKFLADLRKSKAASSTLQTEIEKILVAQLKQYKYKVD